ncbi:sodium-dependent bicarbonate transport family permease [Bosea sp. (in: a-proteobacteria)]|uniref:sodium-dependent bicarbonate transport family permease n=1 Tax=Bosea sp. (in: a-proteobacteria) TaxID=1871050 RepID=UPI00273491B2|nr:sodium-dependent bicarbonate transport family permease [Bosea sp. (in: a-proteobacteria)]MDP3409148.1 sodium-dependent bicarbonate transport family permease [Bosea sp. (in: a-proteobacteria)]
MTSLQLAAANLFSPMTLCFVLGGFAALIRSDLRLPEPVFTALSIYLMLAIGLKGGADLATVSPATMALPILAALTLCIVIPLWCHAALRRLVGLAPRDAAALAAHYGSVSAVTFLAVLSYLDAIGMRYEPTVTALLALMEAPAIVVALLLAGRGQKDGQALGAVLARILSSKSIVLLFGGLIIGLVVGHQGLAPVKPLFGDLFRGLLCLFLLDLGRQAMERAEAWRENGPAIAVFAIVAPVLNAVLGVTAAWLAGMSQGGAVVMATLAASASYIVAPAAVRMALPDANPGLYLTAALALTFPFNLILGIPLYAAMARMLYG